MIPDAIDENDLRTIALRLFADIATATADTDGVSRPAFSPRETETIRILMDFARQEGLVASFDAGNNGIFSLPEDEDADTCILIGSHVDSVPRGGNYDGLAGVISGLLCLVRAKRAGLRFLSPVKVIAMRAEESTWFGPCYIASKALLGTLTAEELDEPHRGDGRPLSQHMADVGIDIERVRRGMPLLDKRQILAYLEVHIEQGPVLVERDLPAAIVSGIRGNFRYKKIACIGEEGHSGAVPLAYRHDPVLAMADLLSGMDAAWHEFVAAGKDLVVTSGMVSTDQHKHALSRIPDSVEFSLDVRSQETDTLARIHDVLMKNMARIEQARAVKFVTGEKLTTGPALCDSDVVRKLQDADRRLGGSAELIASGGGHDAAVFAAAGIPSGMIFIRNRHGSHNPLEAMDIEDFNVATNILFNFLTIRTQARTDIEPVKERPTVFNEIVKIIREQGNAVRAYRTASKAAYSAASSDPDRATGYFMLGFCAEEFADHYYGEPLHADVAERKLAMLENYANELEAAYAGDDARRKLDALSNVSRSIVAERNALRSSNETA